MQRIVPKLSDDENLEITRTTEYKTTFQYSSLLRITKKESLLIEKHLSPLDHLVYLSIPESFHCFLALNLFGIRIIIVSLSLSLSVCLYGTSLSLRSLFSQDSPVLKESNLRWYPPLGQERSMKNEFSPTLK